MEKSSWKVAGYFAGADHPNRRHLFCMANDCRCLRLETQTLDSRLATSVTMGGLRGPRLRSDPAIHSARTAKGNFMRHLLIIAFLCVGGLAFGQCSSPCGGAEAKVSEKKKSDCQAACGGETVVKKDAKKDDCASACGATVAAKAKKDGECCGSTTVAAKAKQDGQCCGDTVAAKAKKDGECCGSTTVAAKAKKDDCGSSCEPNCCDEAELLTLSKQVKAMAANAEKGCGTAKETLAALKKQCGTDCCGEFMETLTKLEAAAKDGCETSKTKLGKMLALVKNKQMPLSAHIAKWTKASKNGCDKSATLLTALKKQCKTECCDDLGKMVVKWEEGAKNGCESSKKHLMELVSLVKAKTAPVSLSKRLAQYNEWAGKGCSTSSELLTAIKKECGTECCSEMTAKITHLEECAAKGCTTSKEMLTKLNKMVEKAMAKPAEKKEEKKAAVLIQ